jgi:hypothetical protein
MPILIQNLLIIYTLGELGGVLRNSYVLGIDYVGLVRARLEEFSVLRGPCIKYSCI